MDKDDSKNKYFYIYNPSQADFFVKNGAEVLEISKGNKGDVYIKFNRTEKEDEIFDRWVKQCQVNKT